MVCSIICKILSWWRMTMQQKKITLLKVKPISFLEVLLTLCNTDLLKSPINIINRMKIIITSFSDSRRSKKKMLKQRRTKQQKILSWLMKILSTISLCHLTVMCTIKPWLGQMCSDFSNTLEDFKPGMPPVEPEISEFIPINWPNNKLMNRKQFSF